MFCCVNGYEVMIESKVEKLGNICAYMVDFCRPSDILYIYIYILVFKTKILNLKRE